MMFVLKVLQTLGLRPQEISDDPRPLSNMDPTRMSEYVSTFPYSARRQRCDSATGIEDVNLPKDSCQH